MADAKFNIFSKGLVSCLVETAGKIPRYARGEIPAYEELEVMAQNSTMPVYLDLTTRQQQDYELLRRNFKELLKQYGGNNKKPSPELTPAEHLILLHARRASGHKEKPEPQLSEREGRIYDTLSFWLNEYARNAALRATRRKKPDF